MKKRWGVVVTEDGWRGEGREEEEGQEVRVSESVTINQFEKTVASKYRDNMFGFQTEFMVSCLQLIL